MPGTYRFLGNLDLGGGGRADVVHSNDVAIDEADEPMLQRSVTGSSVNTSSIGHDLRIVLPPCLGLIPTLAFACSH